MAAFGKQGITIALLIAMAYVIQIQSAAWYVRVVNKVFGKTDAQPPGRNGIVSSKMPKLTVSGG